MQDRFHLYTLKKKESLWNEIIFNNNIGEPVGFSIIPGTRSMLLNLPDVWEEVSTYKTLASVDGGNTWMAVSSGENFRYGFVEFYNANTGYACEIPTSHMENSDNLFIYNGTPLTGILNQQPIESAVDVFPIPCTDDIKVSVKAEIICDYWILVNDVKGKLIHKKVMNDQSEFTTSFATANLPNGEYIITIVNGNGFTAKKFIKN